MIKYMKNNQLIMAGILALITTMVVLYIVNNDFLLMNSFALEEERNNLMTYFAKYFVIYVGIYFFVLGLVLHNKDTLKMFCYAYLTLLLFLFFIKGIMTNPEPQSIPGFRTLASTIDFSIDLTSLESGLNTVMPIPLYPVLAYLMKNPKTAFFIGLIAIILIEPIQLLTNFGNFDINDTYQNLVGYMIGSLIYLIVYYTRKSLKGKS